MVLNHLIRNLTVALQNDPFPAPTASITAKRSGTQAPGANTMIT